MKKLAPILFWSFIACILIGVPIIDAHDDPPKEKKSKRDTIYIRPQEQRSINIEELEQLNKMFDSVNMKNDTLKRKK